MVFPGELFSHSCVIHHVEFGNLSELISAPTVDKTDFAETHQIGCVQVVPQGETVAVHYETDPYLVVPENRRTHRFELSLGEWGRFVYNRRRSDNYEGHWWFEEFSINVGWFDRFNAEVFSANRPDFEHRDMQRLSYSS